MKSYGNHASMLAHPYWFLLIQQYFMNLYVVSLPCHSCISHLYAASCATKYTKVNIKTGNMISSYIFNELQMTVLLLVCTVYLREMSSLLRRQKNLSHSKIHKCIDGVSVVITNNLTF